MVEVFVLSQRISENKITLKAPSVSEGPADSLQLKPCVRKCTIPELLDWQKPQVYGKYLSSQRPNVR